MIIVTGASGGLGKQLVRDLCGSDLVVGTYLRHKPDVEDQAIKLFQVDVTQLESIRQFEDAIRPEATRITLVNLAGVSVNRLAVDLTPGEWDDVLDVNLKGSFLMSKVMLRLMIRERWGRIINVSSIVAENGVPGTVAYAAAKSGILGLTRTLAKEYARYNITVNCLALGYFAAGLTQALSDAQRKSILERIPLRRFGEGGELAGAVRYLMEASYTTGARLDINGGLP